MNRVKKFREASGFTQAKLARMTGLPVNTISSLERKGSNLQATTAKLLSQALGVTERVLRGQGDEEYNWVDGRYMPKKDGEYLVAYKTNNRVDYHYAALVWKNDTWWDKNADGKLTTSFKPKVLWWSGVTAPPI